MADASTGVQPISNGRVLKIAVPIVLSNATVPILGMVDTGVVGQMGTAAPIGAVGIGAVILSAVYWMFGFLRMGTVGLTSQAIGARDQAETSALLTRSLMIGLVAGAAIILLQVPILHVAFLASPASDEVEALAIGYIQIRVWSAPAAIALFGVTGWLIAHERTGAVLALQLWMNGVNVLLDLWFVLGLGWGVNGVAFATFLAEWSGFALGLWLCRSMFRGPEWRNWRQVFDTQRLRHMMSVSGDILIRSLLLEAIILYFMFQGAKFGDVELAANQVLMQFLMITAYGLDGFAFAAETLVGQAMGARRRRDLRRAARQTSLWGTLIAACLSLVFLVAGGAAIDVITKAPDVQETARVYLPYIVLMPLLGVGAFMLDGIFIGATRTRDMRNMMAVSFVVYAVACALLVPVLANHGLWIALLLSFIARTVTLGLRYPALERAAEQPAMAA